MLTPRQKRTNDVALYTMHLFAGAGGGVLADLLVGHRPIGAVEIDPYCRRVLLSRQADGQLPLMPVWDDVRTFRADNPATAGYIKKLRSIRDLLCISGGFPCQDISAAGKGAGIFCDTMPDYNPQFTFSTPYKQRRVGVCPHYSHNTSRQDGVSDGRRYPTDVIHCKAANMGGNVHPTQKPTDLCEYLIRTYSNAGDVILDPFAGSGTTAVAAINSDRSFIGWELMPEYYEAALKRIEQATINKAESLPIEYE